MRDTIYRDDAIRVASGYCHPANVAKELAMLPSAQPQLDEWCDDCKEYDQQNHSCPRFNRVIRETLDDVRKEVLEQRWIPVTERLPDKTGRYLVSCGKWGEWSVNWNIWYNEPKPSWLWNKDVIAWMPLPEPYEEQST